MNIILYLLQLIQQLYQQNCFLINFICKYLPLKQWAFDDSHSPKYQKFKIDQLPLILNVEPWNYLDYMDLNSLPKNASSLRFSKFDSNVMGLCLTMHVNCSAWRGCDYYLFPAEWCDFAGYGIFD